MALVACKDCGKPISSRASICPGCGAGMPVPKSTRAALILISGILIATMIASGIAKLVSSYRPPRHFAATVQPPPIESRVAPETPAEEKARQDHYKFEWEESKRKQELSDARRAAAKVESDKRATDAKAALDLAQAKELARTEEDRKANKDRNEAIASTKVAIAQERKLALEINRSQFRQWITLGGKKASEAKITAYADGVFTLARRNGATVELRLSRFTGADKAYIDDWMTKAGVESP